MSDNANQRTDAYGGSIENRSRLVLEVVEAILKVWEPGRVGIRLSPGPTNDAVDSNPQALFGHLLGELNRFGLAYVHVIEAPVDGLDYGALRRAFNGTYIANGGYTRERATKRLARGAPTLLPSVVPSSRIRTLSSASGSTHPSTSPIAPPSMVVALRVTRTTQFEMLNLQRYPVPLPFPRGGYRISKAIADSRLPVQVRDAVTYSVACVLRKR